MKKSPFLKFLINCGRNQAIALLETCDDNQVQEVIKLLANLRLNLILLPPQSKKLLKRHNNLINKLVNIKTSKSRKYSIIRSNSRQIYNILNSTRLVLAKVVK